MRGWIAVAAGMAACIGAAGSVLAADNFEARSRLVAGRAVATNFSLRVADFQDMVEAARKKHGPKAKTVLQGGRVETTIDGKSC